MSRRTISSGSIRDWALGEYEIWNGASRHHQYYTHTDVDGLPTAQLFALNLAAFGMRWLDLLCEHWSANGGALTRCRRLVEVGCMSHSSNSSRGLICASMHYISIQMRGKDLSSSMSHLGFGIIADRYRALVFHNIPKSPFTMHRNVFYWIKSYIW